MASSTISRAIEKAKTHNKLKFEGNKVLLTTIQTDSPKESTKLIAIELTDINRLSREGLISVYLQYGHRTWLHPEALEALEDKITMILSSIPKKLKQDLTSEDIEIQNCHSRLMHGASSCICNNHK